MRACGSDLETMRYYLRVDILRLDEGNSKALVSMVYVWISYGAAPYSLLPLSEYDLLRTENQVQFMLNLLAHFLYHSHCIHRFVS